MDMKLAAALVKAGEKEGIEIRLYEGYSGRGMYGDTTTGVVVDSMADLVEIASVARKRVSGLRSDNLGFSMIVY